MTALRVRGWIAWRLRRLADAILPLRPRLWSDDTTYRARLVARTDDRSRLARSIHETWLPQTTRDGRLVREILVPFMPPMGPIALGSALAGEVPLEQLVEPLPFGSMRFVLVAAVFHEQTGTVESATYRAERCFPDVPA